MNFFTLLKLFGQKAIQNAIEHNLGKITPDGWTALANNFGDAQKAAIAESKPALAAALTEVLLSIR